MTPNSFISPRGRGSRRCPTAPKSLLPCLPGALKLPGTMHYCFCTLILGKMKMTTPPCGAGACGQKEPRKIQRLPGVNVNQPHVNKQTNKQTKNPKVEAGFALTGSPSERELEDEFCLHGQGRFPARPRGGFTGHPQSSPKGSSSSSYRCTCRTQHFRATP